MATKRITATPAGVFPPGTGNSDARVVPEPITATPAGFGGSAATVQYPGPQITATPEGNQGFVDQLMNAMGMISGLPTNRPRTDWKGTPKTPSAAKVRDTSGGSGGGAIGSVADPQLVSSPAADPNALALQMFFTQTIAPYLDQIRGSMKGNAETVGNAYSSILPQMNPALRPFFNPEVKKGQTSNLADALAASTAAAPSLDQLMSQISAAQEAQRYAAYQAMKAQSGQAAGGLIGALLGAGGEGGDPLAALLGGDLASEAQKKAGS